MGIQYSEKINNILALSRDEALRLGNNFIGPEHLFLGILSDDQNEAVYALNRFGVNTNKLRADIEAQTANNKGTQADKTNIQLLKSAERIIRLLNLEVKSFKEEIAAPKHLLLAILQDYDNLISELLAEQNIDYDLMKDHFMDNPVSQHDMDDDDDEEMEDFNEGAKKQKPTTSKTGSETPVLDNFGVDLTKAAQENALDPIVGREVEIERMVQILSRRKKNNPILIGEPGVGKSAIAEGLAIRIIQRKVSRVLFGKRIVTLDMASVVAGTKYRGQFEERMKSILNELARTNNVILFIDEIHTIIGAGGASGSLDASNMLKPSLARGEIQCIGATTLDEYRQHIEKDGALERRFQKIMVEPTSQDETISILNNIKQRYEDHHNVIYTDEAIKACVKLTDRYISDRHLPDKAIDALDESGSRVHISKIKVPENIDKLEKQIEEVQQEKVQAVKNQDFERAADFRDQEQTLYKKLDDEKIKWEKELIKNRETVDTNSVEEVVAMMTGVPVQRIALGESQKLLQMGDTLKNNVIGQDQAIEKIVKAIQRNRAGLKDPNKPIGSFVFLGPTGVGKTQLAKVIAEFLFDRKDALIRIDMSEYMEKFSVSRLVGAPPGYIGYEEGGQLTEKVRRRPYSVVLLDEIEKAHPDVFHILLQVMDEGRLTDSLGRQVDFKNTIVIMTSNIGTRQIQDFGGGVGFQTNKNEDEHNKSVIQKALRRAFAPEFLNRIDDVVVFNTLSRENIHKIIDIELRGLYKRVEDLGYSIEITPAAKDYIADRGFDSKFGARPLKRAIQKYLEDQMAEVIIQASISEGDTIQVALNENKDGIAISVGKNQIPDSLEKEEPRTEKE